MNKVTPVSISTLATKIKGHANLSFIGFIILHIYFKLLRTVSELALFPVRTERTLNEVSTQRSF